MTEPTPDTTDLYAKLKKLSKELNQTQQGLLAAILKIAHYVAEGMHATKRLHKEIDETAFTPLAPEKVQMIMDQKHSIGMFIQPTPPPATETDPEQRAG